METLSWTLWSKKGLEVRKAFYDYLSFARKCSLFFQNEEGGVWVCLRNSHFLAFTVFISLCMRN